MNKEIIGVMAGIIVLLTLIPYVWRICYGKIQPNLASWFLWAVIAFALLVTYWKSGAKESVWLAVVGCINPFIVTVLIWVKYRDKIHFNRLEQACLVIGIAALVLWFIFRNQKPLIQYALCVAILADACAAVPTAVCYWRDPTLDRPFAWGAFCLASAMNIFAISEHTFANYVYPIWMTVGSCLITIPLVRYRIKKQIPLKEWV